MRKLFCLLTVIAMLCSVMTVFAFGATADLVHQSVEGTAVIDGAKDDAYAKALNLKMDQKGESNGGGALYDSPLADAYILNDAEYVYVLVEVYDDNLDMGNAEVYAQDSVEIFWMENNAQVQIRYRYDGEMSGSVDMDKGHAVVLTDKGYNVEFKMPITDVLNNQIEMCLQINDCKDGVRDATCYITGNPDGDNAYQRTNRESSYDVWWTLTLAGDHADSRTAPEPEDESAYDWELTAENYAAVTEVPYGFQIFTMDMVNYSWVASGGYYTDTFGTHMTHTWTDMANSFFMTEDLTAGYTKDPKFAMQVNDHNYLKLPDGSVQGDTGESAKFVFEYQDIIIKADGYADVIVPGGRYEEIFEIVNMGTYNSGNNFEIDFVKPIKEQLGLDTKGLVEYMLVVDEIYFDINLVEFNGITYDELIAYEEALNAASEEICAKVQPYADEAEAAKDAAKDADKAIDETSDLNAHLEVLKGYLATAQAAYDNAVAAAGDNPDALDLVADCTDAIEDIQKLITRTEEDIAAAAEAAAKAEEERIAAEEAAKAAAQNTTIMIIVIVAVVVIVAIIIIVIVAKSKKSKK